jgi:hypothetical protein
LHFAQERAGRAHRRRNDARLLITSITSARSGGVFDALYAASLPSHYGILQSTGIGWNQFVISGRPLLRMSAQRRGMGQARHPQRVWMQLVLPV